MKFIERDDLHRDEPQYHQLELTRRNLMTLLANLDDPLSHRTLTAPGGLIKVRAVENDEHYSDRPAGEIWMPTAEEYFNEDGSA